MSPNTNAIGTGTATKSFNGPKDFMADLYQWAVAHGISLSEFLRRAAVDEVAKEDPGTAQRLRTELKQYYGSLILALIAFFQLSVAGQARGALFIAADDELRRAPRAYRLSVPSRKAAQ